MPSPLSSIGLRNTIASSASKLNMSVCIMDIILYFLQLKSSLMLSSVILTSLPMEAMDIKDKMEEMQQRPGTVANQ